MPLIEPNFDEVKEIADGEYLARVIDAEQKTSQAGNAMVNWTLEIYGENAGKALGATLRLTTMLTGKGAFKLQQLYKAAHGTDCPRSFDTDTLLNKSVKVLVVREKRDGKETGYADVAAIKAVA